MMPAHRMPPVQNVLAKLRILDERVIAVRQLHYFILTRILDTDKCSARECESRKSSPISNGA